MTTYSATKYDADPKIASLRLIRGKAVDYQCNAVHIYIYIYDEAVQQDSHD